MTTTPTGPVEDSDHYEIRVKGHLDARWSAWFDGLSLTRDSDGTTLMRGPVADQAALHGLLQKLRDLGLPLVSVETTDPPEPLATDTPQAFDPTRSTS